MPVFIEHIPSGLPGGVLAGLALLLILLVFWLGALPTLFFIGALLTSLVLVGLIFRLLRKNF